MYIGVICRNIRQHTSPCDTANMQHKKKLYTRAKHIGALTGFSPESLQSLPKPIKFLIECKQVRVIGQENWRNFRVCSVWARACECVCLYTYAFQSIQWSTALLWERHIWGGRWRCSILWAHRRCCVPLENMLGERIRPFCFAPTNTCKTNYACSRMCASHMHTRACALALKLRLPRIRWSVCLHVHNVARRPASERNDTHMRCVHSVIETHTWIHMSVADA